VSISYYLELAAQAPAAQVAAELHQVATTMGALDTSVAADALLDGAVTGAGTWIRVAEEKPWPDSVVLTDLGFSPTLTVVFQLDKFADHAGQKDGMVRLVTGLLDRVAGDAVLHLDYETVWLVRRGGELELSEREDLWTPARLSAVPPGYRRAALSFAEN
jgi:hypothetical protein